MDTSDALSQRLEEVSHLHATEVSDEIKTISSTLHQEIKSIPPLDTPPMDITSVIAEIMPSSDDPMTSMMGMFKSMLGNPMQLVQQMGQKLSQFAPDRSQMLEWRTKDCMQQILAIDPKAKYMYLSPTVFLPSISGLYVKINTWYILCTSARSEPLIYTEDIITQEWIDQVCTQAATAYDSTGFIRPAIQAQYPDATRVASYWISIDPKYNRRPRPIYIED